jgi:hypothetical protein
LCRFSGPGSELYVKVDLKAITIQALTIGEDYDYIHLDVCIDIDRPEEEMLM